MEYTYQFKTDYSIDGCEECPCFELYSQDHGRCRLSDRLVYQEPDFDVKPQWCPLHKLRRKASENG